jgi:hypothetical protein
MFFLVLLVRVVCKFVSGVSKQKEETEGRERDGCVQNKGVLSLTALPALALALSALAVSVLALLAVAVFAVGCRQYVVVEATIFNWTRTVRTTYQT